MNLWIKVLFENILTALKGGRKLKQDEVKKILEDHAAWLEDENTGKRANFSTGDWRAADLHGADLRKAFISVAADTTDLYD
ncbi:MAG: hypothetical protein IJU91_02890, partial [Selenomonadaceae bacterium]|nr:hypothetical protein [Selenomonadaceae bacterium]